MIGLGANPGPLFMRVNPNAAVFTPYFDNICDWNFGFSTCHKVLLVSLVHLAARVSCLSAGRLLAAEMKRVAQVLQLAIVI